ncbi:UNVERIFIED_CONTAM: Phosphatidylinositol/phosphatidylcholine transfer protein SFH9, partial [Sesamum calycinum]
KYCRDQKRISMEPYMEKSVHHKIFRRKSKKFSLGRLCVLARFCGQNSERTSSAKGINVCSSDGCNTQVTRMRMFILGGLIRKFLKMENMETVPENHRRTQVATSDSQEKNAARPNTKDLLHPCYQKLQHLENSVTELLKKPAKIPPEKEEIIFESLNRIKSIEYDLQKTKKALLATTSKQESFPNHWRY